MGSDKWTEIPFTLHHVGDAPREIDLVGGEVIFVAGIWRGSREVRRPPCYQRVLPPPAIRIGLLPGAKLRGILSWKAANLQFDGCLDMAKGLPPGKYRLRIKTVSGEPALEGEIVVTVTRR